MRAPPARLDPSAPSLFGLERTLDLHRGARLARGAVIAGGLAGLAACAGGPKPGAQGMDAANPHGSPAPSTSKHSTQPSLATAPADYPRASTRGAEVLTSLPGWSEEDHAAALAAFAAGCGVSRDPALRSACQKARSLRAQSAGGVGEEAARAFFEREFRAEALPGEGVLTAYFAPEYAARRAPEGAYTAPVRPKPNVASVTTYASTPVAPPTPIASPTLAAPRADVIDRVLADLDQADDPSPALALPSGPRQPASPPLGATAQGYAPAPVPRGGPAAFATADRTTIEAAPAADALAWMRPEELFFLQIQGSGTLVFPDGGRAKAIYAADNGKPFVAIARPMVAQGLLAPGRASGEGIRAWLAAHPGPQAEAVMRQNPRYVFFALLPDDGREPAGAAGVPLPAGRSLAVDPSRHGYGELYWIDASAPILTGATRRYRRLAMALDTGAAIRGEVRADLYIGRGGAAGEEAGRVRHTLHMVRLVPVGAGG